MPHGSEACLWETKVDLSNIDDLFKIRTSFTDFERMVLICQASAQDIINDFVEFDEQNVNLKAVICM